MSKPREQTERYWLRLDAETKRMLDKLARKRGESKATIVRLGIHELARLEGLKK